MKTFFIGDTHFGHKNIIKYCNRPYRSTDEMDSHLISLWNNKVGPEDRVIHLGDFALSNKSHTASIAKALNGKKTLILGNHDNYSPQFYQNDCGFEFVSPYPIIINRFLICSHEPMFCNSNTPYGNIFAHVHDEPTYRDYTETTFCVSVERKDLCYAPIEFEHMKKLMKNFTP